MADAPVASENFIMDSKGASHVEALSLLQVWENGDTESSSETQKGSLSSSIQSIEGSGLNSS
ncbi:hypothetical protein D910_09462 [Dendroctonus ponderosae]|uniref:Uncharacterized protein n=1 Tax=Dendroctonus ponderosae TaxID=77166 RepID=U4UGI6_DENPD|nr:hypothetical protein D910_09462 [Dendroctonus ponderosae]KAH1008156.1 hypothetical protein HUJ05_008737 [Dendroctonus ponderosae]